MTQRFAYVVAAALAAFVVVVLGAVGAYVLAGGSATTPALAARSGDVNSSAQLPPPPQFDQGQSTIPSGQGSTGQDSGAAGSYPVSADQAVNIALNAVPGASLLQDPRLVSLNGTAAYEVPLNRGTVYVDATTGNVLGSRERSGRRHR